MNTSTANPQRSLADLLQQQAPTGGGPVVNQFYISNSNINAGHDLHAGISPEDLCRIMQAQAATINRLLSVVEVQSQQLVALSEKLAGASTQ